MMKKITFLGMMLLMFAFVRLGFGQEMMLNGGVESWDDATHPTDWTVVYNIDQESDAANVHGGAWSAKHTGGTKKLGQTINGVVGGDSYTISLWYKVIPQDGTDARIWSYWKAGGSNLSDNAAELRGPNSAYLDNNGGVWTEYTVTLNAPATADAFYFELRTYSGAVVYWDDMSFFHNAAGGVEAPVFSPVAGTYFGAQDVTITSATAGASIYYTTDGTDPDNTSTLYTAPVNIAATTTLKAIAIKAGMTDSPIITGVYNITTAVAIADLATLRTQAQDGTIYQLNSEAFLTFQQSYRHQKFIQDGTAGILIDDSPGNLSTTYNIGDGITGIIGTLGSYKGMLQFIPAADAGAATSTGNTITPVVISATEFVTNFENYEGQLVRVDNLTFADAGSTFANGHVYPTTDPSANALDFRTSFYGVDYIGTNIPTGGRDIVGIANERDNPYLTARDAADIVNHAPVIPLGSTGIMIAGLLMAAVVVIRKGKLF